MARTGCDNADAPPCHLVPHNCAPMCHASCLLHVTPLQVARPLLPHTLHCYAPCASLLYWCNFLFFFFLLMSSLPMDVQPSSPSRAYHSPTTNCDDDATTVIMMTATPHSVATPSTTTIPHGVMAVTATHT